MTSPAVFALFGHPLRWQLMSELVRSDRRVQELVTLTGRPQNLVSYHLRRLRSSDVELVTARPSSADGRDTYYRLDLRRCADLLAEAGGALHPGLRPTVPASGPPTLRRHHRVLFLCTGNSARSQIAEGLVGHLSGGTVEAYSAGSDPKPLHPNAIRAADEYGVDLRDRHSKNLSRFRRRRFDEVISLCDRVREVCPEFPGAEAVHWSVPDPSRADSSAEDTYPAFQRVAAELHERITWWLLAIQPQTHGGQQT